MAAVLIVEHLDANAMLVLNEPWPAASSLDSTYLRLDCINDPLQATLETRALATTLTNTYDIGSDTLRYAVVHGDRANFLRRTASGTLIQTNVSHVFGRIRQTSTGVATLQGITTTPFSSSFIFGAVSSTSTGNSTAGTSGVGNVSLASATATNSGHASAVAEGTYNAIFGHAETTTSQNATINSDGASAVSFVHGYASAGLGPASILAAAGAYGAFVQGFAGGGLSVGTSASIFSSCFGGFSQGFVEDGGTIGTSGAGGASAQGYVSENGMIQATAGGARASGYAVVRTIEAIGRGSEASGDASGAYNISASGRGARANGYADTAAIIASADNSIQWGPGTNNVANSCRVGSAGLHLKGTTGAFGTGANGQIWMAGTSNAFVFVRCNGQNLQLAKGSTYNQAAYSTVSATITAATTALTDNTAGTANDTLQALPDPADTPATADALRDDLVANLIPALRNNYADLAAKCNALRTDILNVKQNINRMIDDLQATNFAG